VEIEVILEFIICDQRLAANSYLRLITHSVRTVMQTLRTSLGVCATFTILESNMHHESVSLLFED
jgi:hypothetical protein